MQCLNCGAQLEKKAKYCPVCGYPVTSVKSNKKIGLIIGISVGVVCLLLIIGIILFVCLSGNRAQEITIEKYELYCEEINSIESKYLDGEGYINEDDYEKVMNEVYEYATKLYEEQKLSKVSYKPDKGDSCVYMEIDNWFNLFYTPPLKETLSGGDDVEIYTYEPYEGSPEMLLGYQLSGYRGADQSSKLLCNKFDKYHLKEEFDNAEVNLENIQKMNKNSIIIWNGHGEFNDELGSFLGIGVKKHDKSAIPNFWELHDEKSLGMNNKGQFYITSVYIDKHMKDNCLENSIVYLNACKSATDQRLIDAFANKGANCILGNTGETWIPYCMAMQFDFFKGLTKYDSEGNLNSFLEALDYAKKKNGEIDPMKESMVRMFYDKDENLAEHFNQSYQFSYEQIKNGLYMENDVDDNIIYVTQDKNNITLTLLLDYTIKAFDVKGKMQGNEAYFTFDQGVFGEVVSGTLSFKDNQVTLTLDTNDESLNKYQNRSFKWSRDTLWTLSDEQIKEVLKVMNVPDGLDVEIIQSNPQYWDAAQRYWIYVEVMYDAKQVAAIGVDPFTAEHLRLLKTYIENDDISIGIPDNASEFNGHYYYIYSASYDLDWEGAKAFCEEQGGHLATISSKEEDQFLYSLYKKTDYSGAMFGLHNLNLNGEWQWVTGEPFNYKNWHEGEPNNEGNYEHYGMYYQPFDDGKWNDGDGVGGPFICEWD